MVNRVRELRQLRNLTQGQLASLSGMSIGAIQRIDSNRAAQPRLPTAMRIARALDVSIESLLA